MSKKKIKEMRYGLHAIGAECSECNRRYVKRKLYTPLPLTWDRCDCGGPMPWLRLTWQRYDDYMMSGATYIATNMKEE